MTTERLRMGIDGDALRRPMSGVGQYIFQLCRELESLLPSADFYVYSRLPADGLALPSSRWVLRQEPRAIWRKLPSFLWLKTRGRTMCLRDRINVFWAGRTLHPNLPQPARTVVTVHDLNHLLVPKTMERPTLWSNQLWFARDVSTAQAVAANSGGTAQRLQQLVGCTPHAVVRPGVGPWFKRMPVEHRSQAMKALADISVRTPYLLWVGTLEPRKNVRALLAAYQLIQRQDPTFEHQLVLVGVKGWHDPALAAALQRAPGVVVTGFVPDAILPTLYGLAAALVCPSLYEGFGMPVLEARACGTPVVVTDIPELREAGGADATLIAPSIEGIAEGMRTILRASSNKSHIRDEELMNTWGQSARTLCGLLTGTAGSQEHR